VIGRLVLNGESVTSSEPEGEFVDSYGSTLLLFSETLDGRKYQILDSPEYYVPWRGPVTVGPGRYFVAGDNRANSRDSRFFGTISREHVLAPISSIYWSWDFDGPYRELFQPSKIWDLLRRRTRWSRFGLVTN
jgi:signal peptidase I